MKASYCSQCGQAVTVREIEGRQRVACPSCATVFYENPLPVAAAIVLGPGREALLVRRRHEPHRGEWCLPMGFAELRETIAEAALRELREEAGVTGEIVRLVGADSAPSGHYGDLLIVTFEVRRTGGVERPGDDAEEVRYFPLDRLPPLPFGSNEKALAACAAEHREAWEIQDSFVTLQREGPKAMLSDDLVALVQDRAGEVARRWLDDVRSSPTTPSYRALSGEDLLERVAVVLSQLGRWLRGDEAAREIAAFYLGLAAERKAQGFGLHEVLSSLMLLKKHVWEAARSQGVAERPIEMYRLLELNRRTAVFFDKAMYHTARGFMGSGLDS